MPPLSAPRYSPAVLAALARWDAARRAVQRARVRGERVRGQTDNPLATEYDHARWDLEATLDALPLVHNHGPEEGPGLSCRESVINGRLVGECMLDAAMHAAESEALDEARRASPFRFTAKPRTEPML